MWCIEIDTVGKAIVFIGRTFGLWFLISLLISLIPLFAFTMSSNTGNMDTERLIEGMNLLTEWLKWFLMSQVQLISIIGTVIINLGYELNKNRNSGW